MAAAKSRSVTRMPSEMSWSAPARTRKRARTPLVDVDLKCVTAVRDRNLFQCELQAKVGGFERVVREMESCHRFEEHGDEFIAASAERRP